MDSFKFVDTTSPTVTHLANACPHRCWSMFNTSPDIKDHLPLAW